MNLYVNAPAVPGSRSDSLPVVLSTRASATAAPILAWRGVEAGSAFGHVGIDPMSTARQLQVPSAARVRSAAVTVHTAKQSRPPRGIPR